MIRKLTIATYTPTQRVELEKFYQEFHEGESPKSPSDEKLKVEELSGSIGLTPDQIRMWCRNRKKRGAYKGRSALAVEQVRILEWLFTNHSNYPSTVLKKRVASELGITYSQLQKWFETRRQRGAPILISKFEIEDAKEWNACIDRLKQLIDECEKGGATTKGGKGGGNTSAASVTPLQSTSSTDNGLSTAEISSPPSKRARTSSPEGNETKKATEKTEPLTSTLPAVHKTFPKTRPCLGSRMLRPVSQQQQKNSQNQGTASPPSPTTTTTGVHQTKSSSTVAAAALFQHVVGQSFNHQIPPAAGGTLTHLRRSSAQIPHQTQQQQRRREFVGSVGPSYQQTVVDPILPPLSSLTPSFFPTTTEQPQQQQASRKRLREETLLPLEPLSHLGFSAMTSSSSSSAAAASTLPRLSSFLSESLPMGYNDSMMYKQPTHHLRDVLSVAEVPQPSSLSYLVHSGANPPPKLPLLSFPSSVTGQTHFSHQTLEASNPFINRRPPTYPLPPPTNNFLTLHQSTI